MKDAAAARLKPTGQARKRKGETVAEGFRKPAEEPFDEFIKRKAFQ